VLAVDPELTAPTATWPKQIIGGGRFYYIESCEKVKLDGRDLARHDGRRKN
jgi:hypothetical protein